ncbi:hypothetical protein [Streptomyces sp. NPDC001492]
MSRHEEMCPHCRGKAGLDETPTVEAREITLPAVPTAIRVHQSDQPPFDCTLHPDGTLTAVLAGELRRNHFTLAEMCERNWAGAHIEFDPPPLIEEPEPEPAPAVVQGVIPLTVA